MRRRTTKDLSNLLKALSENLTRETVARTTEATPHGKKLNDICTSLQQLTFATTTKT